VSGEHRRFRVWWLFARTRSDERAPRTRYKDYVRREDAVAHKERLHRQYGDTATACVTVAPAPKARSQRQAPAPAVTEEANARFWVSAYVPPRNGAPAVIQHRGFVERKDAENCKAELKAPSAEVAVCLSAERPPGARVAKARGRGR
jgi:hypothetical protein